jgi:hypothetical protein
MAAAGWASGELRMPGAKYEVPGSSACDDHKNLDAKKARPKRAQAHVHSLFVNARTHTDFQLNLPHLFCTHPQFIHKKCTQHFHFHSHTYKCSICVHKSKM